MRAFKFVTPKNFRMLFGAYRVKLSMPTYMAKPLIIISYTDFIKIILILIKIDALRQIDTYWYNVYCQQNTISQAQCLYLYNHSSLYYYIYYYISFP